MIQVNLYLKILFFSFSGVYALHYSVKVFKKGKNETLLT